LIGFFRYTVHTPAETIKSLDHPVTPASIRVYERWRTPRSIGPRGV